jgi:hypothetical protein
LSGTNLNAHSAARRADDMDIRNNASGPAIYQSPRMPVLVNGLKIEHHNLHYTSSGQ